MHAWLETRIICSLVTSHLLSGLDLLDKLFIVDLCLVFVSLCNQLNINHIDALKALSYNVDKTLFKNLGKVFGVLSLEDVQQIYILRSCS